MFQVTPTIWNEIAATQTLKSPLMKKWMALPQEELPPELDRVTKELESAGASPRATLAYLTVAPLLLENEAISRYLQSKDNESLRAGLPELTTVDEALSLATLEYNLTAKEQAGLRKLLTSSLDGPLS
jgi:hypothetical protein